jgi:hypothetical protein
MALNLGAKISSSLTRFHNDNTLALAHLNLDFSLVKVVVPEEYKSLGINLSSQRRETAEEGSQHRTARKLGALFERLLPDSPLLVRAYGRRCSEIAKTILDSRQNTSRGVFESHAGVDATSIWAAATSGPAAICVHLLACVLARSWSGPEATAIWVEMVNERKRVILREQEQGVHNVSLECLTATRLGVSRHDLGQWDASARSWLQIADEGEMKRQKQLMLILNNIDLPVTQKETTYENVLDAWTSAINGMEKLIVGQSQRTANGSLLLGLSSWHLFPDLIVLGDQTQNIQFEDQLVSYGGVLSIGLENTEGAENRGLYWSLSLAHLRYYGDPVRVSSESSRESSRLSMDDFEFVVFGSLIADWGPQPVATWQAMSFFESLSGYLKQQKSMERSRSGQSLSEATWFRTVVAISIRFLCLEETEQRAAMSLISQGTRKAQNLLASRAHRPPPYFGLLDDFVLSRHCRPSSATDQSEQVDMMRFIASKLALQPFEAIIRIKTGRDVKYATAVHFEDCSTSSGTHHNITWLLGNESHPLRPKFIRDGCACHASGHSCHKARCPCLGVGLACSVVCHRRNIRSNKKCAGCLSYGHDKLLNHNPAHYSAIDCDNSVEDESIEYVDDNLFYEVSLDQATSFPSLPCGCTKGGKRRDPIAPLFIQANVVLAGTGTLCKCFTSRFVKGVGSTFSLLAGNPDTVALFFCLPSSASMSLNRLNPHHQAQILRLADAQEAARQQRRQADANHILQIVQSKGPDLERLVVYLEDVTSTGRIQIPIMSKDLHIADINIKPFMVSLGALALAKDVYRNLPGATITKRLMSSQIHKGHWIPIDGQGLVDEKQILGRNEKFACIAMFESGAYNLVPSDLDEVMAICSRNTIYVSDILLCDPHGCSHENDIRLLMGNVGMAMMVAPQAPRLKELGVEHWTQILHAPFNGIAEDNFGATSLHLSFTKYEMPFDVGNRGGIDNDLCFVETLISVLDRGKWVADLDVLALHRAQQSLLRRPLTQKHCIKHASSRIPKLLASFDTWEEILDAPERLGKDCVGVVRARDNWMGRLAAACVSIQKGYRTVLLPPDYDEQSCWSCYTEHSWYWDHEAMQSGLRDSANVAKGQDFDAAYDDIDDGYDSGGSTGTAIDHNEYDEDEDDTLSRGLPHIFIF